MSYKITFDADALLDIKKHQVAGNKKLVAKIRVLLAELVEHPRTGTGKPEQLRRFITEVWSRRIDSKHRLVYKIIEDELRIIAVSAFGHYGDK